MTRRSLVAAALLSASLAAAATTTPSTAPDVDTAAARQAFRAYADAMTAGDAAAARALVVADAKRLRLVDGRPAAAAAERQFRAAVAKAFPAAAGVAAADTATQPATRPAGDLDPPVVRVEGDSATLTARDEIDAVKLRRVDGGWKIDLNAMYPAEVADDLVLFRQALQDVMAGVSADVAAGRFKSYDAVQAELETRVKMKLATPDESSTTRPAF